MRWYRLSPTGDVAEKRPELVGKSVDQLPTDVLNWMLTLQWTPGRASKTGVLMEDAREQVILELEIRAKEGRL